MITYTLPQMKEVEHKLLRLISGNDRILTEWQTWPSGELSLHITGMEPKVCVIGRTIPPAENLVRTILLMDTLQRSGSKNLTLVVPYLAYSRQDRPRELGDPNFAACMTRLIAGMGVDRLVTLDLHSNRVVESSHVMIQNVSVLPEMAAVLSKGLGKTGDFVVVSPDRGGCRRAELFAAGLGLQQKPVWIEKERGPAGVQGKRVMGRVEARSAVIIDDILDSGATVKEAVRLLREMGVMDFYLCVVHPVCSGRAPQLLREIQFKKILFSDSLDAPVEVVRMKEVQVVSASHILAEAVLGGPTPD